MVKKQRNKRYTIHALTLLSIIGIIVFSHFHIFRVSSKQKQEWKFFSELTIVDAKLFLSNLFLWSVAFPTVQNSEQIFVDILQGLIQTLNFSKAFSQEWLYSYFLWSLLSEKKYH